MDDDIESDSSIDALLEATSVSSASIRFSPELSNNRANEHADMRPEDDSHNGETLRESNNAFSQQRRSRSAKSTRDSKTSFHNIAVTCEELLDYAAHHSLRSGDARIDRKVRQWRQEAARLAEQYERSESDRYQLDAQVGRLRERVLDARGDELTYYERLRQLDMQIGALNRQYRATEARLALRERNGQRQLERFQVSYKTIYSSLVFNVLTLQLLPVGTELHVSLRTVYVQRAENYRVRHEPEFPVWRGSVRSEKNPARSALK